jgi:chemotaxis protein methyltransferase CheR
MAADLHLTPEDLRTVCDFVYRRTGMSYGEAKRYYIERRVAERMERAGTPTFAAYMVVLRGAGGEAEQLVNSFTVNETYFYREDHQLRCLSRSLLPEIVAKRGPGDLVRIWCVPCSTGEEPYSVAIWLLENWPLVDAYNIEIVGSDIDTRALAEAAEGDYGARALSRLPPDIVARYFEPSASPYQAGGDRRIIQDLRESVRFTPVNLVDSASMAGQGRFDIIFCRNVLIYFDDRSRQLAADNLYAALIPGGFICLGHTESMTRISDRFAMRRFADAIVFQRPGEAAAPRAADAG